MSKAPKDLRIPIMMSTAEVEAIDEWRFSNKIATRAEAVRRLCQMGIALDTESKKLLELATVATEAAKQATLLRMYDMKGELPDPMQANIALVDTLGSTARLNGFISSIVSASDVIKDPVSEEETATYKEALQKLSEKRKILEHREESE